jgi:hypothetical protein
VAAALAAGDGCTAQRLAGELRTQVTAASSAGRASPRLLAALAPAVDPLAGRITCNPAPTPAPAPAPTHEKHHKPPKHEHEKKKKKEKH